MFNAPEHFQLWDITSRSARRQSDAAESVLCAATRLYYQAQHRGWLRHVWLWLQGRPDRLVDLTKMRARLLGSAYEGVRMVDIADIRGSEGRCDAFDSALYPKPAHIRDRWLAVAAAMCAGQGLPPVHLVRIGRAYFVRDGHHRISVARTLGQESIEAEIIAWDVEGEPFGRLEGRHTRIVWNPPARVWAEGQ